MIDQKFQFDSIFEKYSDYPALSWPDGELNYREYFRQIDRVAHFLKKHGLRENQSVAILSDTHKNFPIIFFGVIKAGGVAVSLNSSLPPDQLSQLISQTSCQFVITFENQSYTHTLPGIKITTDKELMVAVKYNQHDCEPWSISFNKEVSILFTSGSRGHAKGVLHTFGNHYYSALGSAENISLQAKDRWLTSLPFYHIAGISILFRTLLAGVTCVIPEPGKPIVSQIRDGKATHLSMVETQLYHYLNSAKNERSLSSLKAVLLGGGSISQSLIHQALKQKVPIFVSYGSTEMCSQITTTKQGELEKKPGASGKILPYREMTIASDNEICVRGKTLCRNYMVDGKRKKVIESSEWFRTGDLGYLDDDGSLFILGRKDNMFISGGENIHPEEIERCLLTYPNISETCVVDIPDQEFGARPVAFVKTAGNHPLDHAAMTSYLQQHLPKYKIPDHFFAWPADLENLKPDRIKLRMIAIKAFLKETDEYTL